MAYNKNDPADVREMQEYLRYLATHYPRIPRLAVDGIYDARTEEAVRAFQELFGLLPTGEVDETTWETLVAEYRRLIYPHTRPQPIYPFPVGDHTLQLGDEGQAVWVVQVMLDTISARYSNLPRVTATGRYDRATAEAVRRLQTLFGYEPTGVVDRRTWDTLAHTYNTHVGR